tara:strand:+ start:159 stop:2102 length:1944 start_codon:yes stop_codon:yes gene_type:complete
MGILGMKSKSKATSINKIVTRRAFIVGGFQFALLAGAVGRLYQLQVLDADRYKMLADENRINLQLVAPLRGRIFDRFGLPLAENKQNYRLIIIPEQAGNIKVALKALSRLLLLSEYEQQKIKKEALLSKNFLPITVRENLSWREVSRIEVSSPELPGINIEVGDSRYYQFGSQAVHLVGYVGLATKQDINKEKDPIISLPSVRVGKNGIEKHFETKLRGKAGSRQVEINAFGRVIRELARDDGLPGDDHVLTIDMGLQSYAMSTLGDESAGCVVLDIHTGDILTLISSPSYDPNMFTTGISQGQWDLLLNHPRFPLTNKAISGLYPPGSTFKMMVALAALEAKSVNPNTSFFCQGHITLGDTKFHCWRRGGHGTVTMESAIQKSCDVYFYEVAKLIGIERIGEMARRFGLGNSVGIELPGEKGGLVPSKEWKQSVHGTPWQLGETLIVGIGQGYLLATPLQLAVMVARIANGGVAISPRLIQSVYRAGKIIEHTKKPAQTMNISPADLAIIQRGMRQVTNSPGGTAYKARIQNSKYLMAGKTGSSQVKRISELEREQGGYKNEDRPWRDRDHALFVGYAPIDAPRYAVAVVVEHGGAGSSVAAPMARDILTEVQRRDPARKESVRKPFATLPDEIKKSYGYPVAKKS